MMENNNQFLYMPQMQVTSSSVSDNQIDSNDTFDAIFSNNDPDLLQFMIFDGGFAETDFSFMNEAAAVDAQPANAAAEVARDLQINTISGSPEFSWQIDDEAPVSDSARNEHRDEGDSGGVATKTKRDRSKTIVTERKRRVRMKEKLYELRSLVPNITKMDKASIIADAVVYVKDLQSQAKKLTDEICLLESSSNDYQAIEASNKNVIESTILRKSSTSMNGTIMKIDSNDLGEGRFYVKVKGITENVMTSCLYTCIESFSCFNLESSNFSMTSNEFELTLTFMVGGFDEEINTSNMKLWLMGALIKQGFEIEKTLLL